VTRRWPVRRAVTARLLNAHCDMKNASLHITEAASIPAPGIA
jgi:hypothetical protein